MVTKRQLDELFVTAISNAISHVKEFQGRYWNKNLEHPVLLGEFVTALRREFSIISRQYPALQSYLGSICRKEAWEGVGLPSWAIVWEFSSDGEWHMSHERIEQLCREAHIKSSYKISDQDTVEVNVNLFRLEQQLKEINATVGVAASLNSEADKVCGKLCEIAESLV